MRPPPEMQTAAPTGIGNGGNGKSIATDFYRITSQPATDFAASVIAARFGISPCLARVICELAAIGGRVA